MDIREKPPRIKLWRVPRSPHRGSENNSRAKFCLVNKVYYGQYEKVNGTVSFTNIIVDNLNNVTLGLKVQVSGSLSDIVARTE